MSIMKLPPAKIEKKSFEIITAELENMDMAVNGRRYLGDDPSITNVIKRCIHTTADFDYARTMYFSEGATGRFSELIRSGATIVTDTNMALSGINKKILEKYGCRAYCFMGDADIAEEANKRAITRASVSMEHAMKLAGPVIFVIGNAPTALITLKEHYDPGDYAPAFIIGVPVGFVNVTAAKEMIMKTDIPFIINSGRKGGSNVAASIVNAMLYNMERSDKFAEGGSVSDYGRNPRSVGFTTGTCAAAAAKAATEMLLTGKRIDRIAVDTPSNIRYETGIEDVMLTSSPGSAEPGPAATFASCAVRKPSCDDPDVTAGMLIYAKAEFAAHKGDENSVIIDGGSGIGRITKPGLDREVGEYAINTVPRRMITQEVLSVMDEYEYSGCIRITISAPAGEEIAEKTFNPKLGIEGGISIIGTSGLVEPMSTKALIDTIRVQLRQQKAMGAKVAVVTPGNYGLDFMRKKYGYDLDKAVKCSNYIGDTIDIAEDLGFVALLIAGHIGKLVKIAGGIMNTHSKEADCRMEIMAAAAVRNGADNELIMHVLGSVSTEEAYGYLLDAGIADGCMAYITERIEYHLKKRAMHMSVGCIVYSNKYGLLGTSADADELLERARG